VQNSAQVSLKFDFCNMVCVIRSDFFYTGFGVLFTNNYIISAPVMFTGIARDFDWGKGGQNRKIL